MIYRVVIFAFLFIFSSLPVSAQRGQSSDRPARPTARPAPSVAPSAGRTSPSVGRTSPGLSRATVRTTPGSSSGSVNSGGGNVVPVQSYGGGYNVNSGDWYRCNMFLGRLYGQYSFLPVDDYLWRYAQGDSPFTPEAVRFALRDSVTASRSLQQLGQDLNDTIDAYSRGDMTRSEFSSQLAVTTRELRRSAKQIRKDYVLDYLEQGSSDDVPNYAEPRNLDQLRALSAALQQTTEKIGDVLTGYFERDTTRVVSVQDLQTTSTETLSKQVDRIAKVIEKSGRKL